MTFKLTLYDDDLLVYKVIFQHFILCAERLVLSLVFLDELWAHYNNIPAWLNKNAIWLNKLFVPQENVVIIVMSDWRNDAFIWTFNDFYHLINSKGVTWFVSSVNRTAWFQYRYLFADIRCLNINEFALLVYYFKKIFVNLEH